jgi:hypothetical protein
MLVCRDLLMVCRSSSGCRWCRSLRSCCIKRGRTPSSVPPRDLGDPGATRDSVAAMGGSNENTGTFQRLFQPTKSDLRAGTSVHSATGPSSSYPTSHSPPLFSSSLSRPPTHSTPTTCTTSSLAPFLSSLSPDSLQSLQYNTLHPSSRHTSRLSSTYIQPSPSSYSSPPTSK